MYTCWLLGTDRARTPSGTKRIPVIRRFTGVFKGYTFTSTTIDSRFCILLDQQRHRSWHKFGPHGPQEDLTTDTNCCVGMFNTPGSLNACTVSHAVTNAGTRALWQYWDTFRSPAGPGHAPECYRCNQAHPACRPMVTILDEPVRRTRGSELSRMRT